MCENVGELADGNSWLKVGQTHVDAYKQLTKLHHYRTKTSVFHPRGRSQELPMLIEADWGEEE